MTTFTIYFRDEPVSFVSEAKTIEEFMDGRKDGHKNCGGTYKFFAKDDENYKQLIFHGYKCDRCGGRITIQKVERRPIGMAPDWRGDQPPLGCECTYEDRFEDGRLIRYRFECERCTKRHELQTRTPTTNK